MKIITSLISSSLRKRFLPSELIFVVLAVPCLTVLPKSQAVVPAPDGGYPGFNTAEGQNALFSLTAGAGNTAVGWYSLFSNTEGSFNTATGVGALLFNTGDQNTAFGAAALLLNTTGGYNTAMGATALLNNTVGYSNTAIGLAALYSNTEGRYNTAIGEGALLDNTTGQLNTAIAPAALNRNTTGENNTAVGYAALLGNTTGETNIAVGSFALNSNDTGNDNCAMGANALAFNSTGSFNTAVGGRALYSNTGAENTANGYQALTGNTTGIRNTANGAYTLLNNTTGSNNIALGFGAGAGLTTGSGNVCIGFGLVGVSGESNTTRISNIWGQSGGTQAVYVDSGGRLGMNTSSRRFKEEIKPMDKASEAIYSLKPVSFRYKKEIEPTRPLSFGLIAEDVEPINADLVLHGNDGKVSTVRYEAVNAMLLNEFIKEHRKNEEQQAVIAQLKSADAEQRAIIAEQGKQIEALTVGLQKVGAQLAAASPSDGGLELGKFATGRIRGGGPARQTVKNNN